MPAGRYIRTRDMYESRRHSLSDVARILEEKTERVTETGCRIWNGRIALNGYGTLIFNGKTIYAHRAAYLVEHGELPEAPMIRHKCGVRCCTEPTHLEPGTARENSMDMVRHGTMPYGDKGSRSKLTEIQAKSILSDARTNLEIAKDYGVSPSQVSRIKSGKRWPHLRGDVCPR